MKRFYLVTRDLHLYFGLFCAPFVLIFAASVFFLVHAWAPGSAAPLRTRHAAGLKIAAELEALDGRARVDAVHKVLDALGIKGEVGFITHVPSKHLLVVPVSLPGHEAVVELDLPAATAKITERTTGVWDAVIALHKAPGPHLAAIRMNWFPMRIWRWLADATAYLLFFISLSGVYLWAVLRSERRVGLALLAAGAASFSGIVYAICR